MGELDEVAERAVARIDAVIVGDVVAVVPAGRGLERHQPDRGDAEPLQIIEPAQQALEIADAVAVGVHVGADGQAIEDAVLVPEVVDHSRASPSRPHRPSTGIKWQPSAGFPARAKLPRLGALARWRTKPESARVRPMESPARQISLVPPPDRRQSETALAIARGTARLLRSLGFSCISELPLPSGRRADLVALNERGEIWIVEIKSSIEDLRADQKWQDYRAALRPAVLRLHAGSAVRDLSAGYRPDRRRRLWRASALRGAGASAAGADPQADDGAVCDSPRRSGSTG